MCPRYAKPYDQVKRYLLNQPSQSLTPNISTVSYYHTHTSQEEEPYSIRLHLPALSLFSKCLFRHCSSKKRVLARVRGLIKDDSKLK